MAEFNTYNDAPTEATEQTLTTNDHDTAPKPEAEVRIGEIDEGVNGNRSNGEMSEAAQAELNNFGEDDDWAPGAFRGYQQRKPEAEPAADSDGLKAEQAEQVVEQEPEATESQPAEEATEHVESSEEPETLERFDDAPDTGTLKAVGDVALEVTPDDIVVQDAAEDLAVPVAEALPVSPPEAPAAPIATDTAPAPQPVPSEASATPQVAPETPRTTDSATDTGPAAPALPAEQDSAQAPAEALADGTAEPTDGGVGDAVPVASDSSATDGTESPASPGSSLPEDAAAEAESPADTAQIPADADAATELPPAPADAPAPVTGNGYVPSATYLPGPTPVPHVGASSETGEAVQAAADQTPDTPPVAEAREEAADVLQDSGESEVPRNEELGETDTPPFPVNDRRMFPNADDRLPPPLPEEKPTLRERVRDAMRDTDWRNVGAATGTTAVGVVAAPFWASRVKVQGDPQELPQKRSKFLGLMPVSPKRFEMTVSVRGMTQKVRVDSFFGPGVAKFKARFKSAWVSH